jgi:transglutaminase/protease-like cytokinesis protein 3
MKKLFFLFFVFFCSSIFAQIQVDSLRYKRAQKAPKILDVKYLARFLRAGAMTDEKTVETFYYWIHQNIEYDVDLSKKDNLTEADVSVLKTLENKKTICAGYANLFFELCQAVKIECVVVEGVAQNNDEKISLPHAWNVVKLNNEWKFIETTWGSGGVSEEGSFVPELDLTYLFCKPENFILEHFPDEEKWQLLTNPISKVEFSSKEYIEKRILFFNRDRETVSVSE